MGELFEQAKGSTIVWIILSLATLLSLGWGIYSHLSANKKKQFSVASSTFEIIKHGKNKIQNLQLMFNGDSIDNLTISKFAIWNSGNKVINSDDMVTGREIEICSDKNANILDVQIVAEVEPANSFKIVKSTAHNISIGFDYVDRHEGVVVQIFHTGDKNSLYPRYKIKGGSEMKKHSAKSRQGNKHLHIKTIMRIFVLLMCVETMLVFFMAFYMTVYLIDIKKDILSATWRYFFSFLFETKISEPSLILLSVGMWGFAGILFFFTGKAIRDEFTIGVPSKLKIFATNIDDE